MTAVTLEDVIALVREIRPDLAEDEITAGTLPEADLGLDSLDLIQLTRMLRKRHRVHLDLEAWPWKAQGLGTVLDHVEPL